MNPKAFQNREIISPDSRLIVFAIVSLLSLTAAFAIFALSPPKGWGYLLLGVVAALQLSVTLAVLLVRRGAAAQFPSLDGEDLDEEAESKLAALSDAGEFFGASLRPDDLFRLIASRLSEIVPYTTCVLYAADDESGTLRLKFAAGENANHFTDAAGSLSGSLATKAFRQGLPETDPDLEIERSVHSAEALRGSLSGAAFPLSVDGEPIGCLVLYSAVRNFFGGAVLENSEAAASRIAPLVASSFSFKQSIDNALTDPVTSLPNERGFFLVLESQVAESLRFRETRPLTVLAVDIAGFSEFNDERGHAAGNLLLSHVASGVKSQLRQMDVLTRSSGDEFLAILPTANESVAEEIVARIKRHFETLPFVQGSDGERRVSLNFGTATFWRDGETATALLSCARTRKQELKVGDGKLLFFPR